MRRSAFAIKIGRSFVDYNVSHVIGRNRRAERPDLPDAAQSVRRQVPDGQTKPDDRKRRISVRIPADQNDPLAYSNGVLTNFTGNEFFVTFYQVLPPPFHNPGELPDVLDAKIVSRIAITPDKWAEAVDSFVSQIKKLRDEGSIPPRPDVQSDEEE